MELPPAQLSERFIKLLKLSDSEKNVLTILCGQKMAKPVSLLAQIGEMPRMVVRRALLSLVERNLALEREYGIYGERSSYMLNRTLFERLQKILF